MPLASSLIHFVNSRSARRFEAATLDPRGVQTQKLMTMVRQNAATEYGRRHGFDKITTVQDYQKHVRWAIARHSTTRQVLQWCREDEGTC